MYTTRLYIPRLYIHLEGDIVVSRVCPGYSISPFCSIKMPPFGLSVLPGDFVISLRLHNSQLVFMLNQLKSIPPKLNQKVIFTVEITASLSALLQDDYSFEASSRLLKNLPEQLKVQSIKDGQTRIRSLIGKLFTRLVLNYVKHLLVGSEFEPFKEITFTYNQYGKPSWDLPIQFNSSNSNDILSLVVEFDNSPIGIDLSHSKQAISETDFMDQFDPIFHPVERLNLLKVEELGDRYMAFNRLWTLKEAFTKLLGSGLNIDLSRFYFVEGLETDKTTDKTSKEEISKETDDEETSKETDEETSKETDDEETSADKRSLMTDLSLTWSDSQLNVDLLEDNPFLVALPSKEFHCYSSILKETEGELPVFISLITQTTGPIRAFSIDFERVLAQSAK